MLHFLWNTIIITNISILFFIKKKNKNIALRNINNKYFHKL